MFFKKQCSKHYHYSERQNEQYSRNLQNTARENRKKDEATAI